MLHGPRSAMNRVQATAVCAGSVTGIGAGPPTALDRAFIALQNAYRPHGGLSRLRGLACGRVADAGGLVDTGAVFGFRWHDDLWIPLFQFDTSAVPVGSVAAGPRRVVAELGRGFDGWALAQWFVHPCDSLAGQMPIECLPLRLPEVLEAARADRVAAAG